MQNYQKNAVNSYLNNIQQKNCKGLYVFHEVGSGKTRTSLEIFQAALNENWVKNALVVTTSSVLQQFDESAQAFGNNIYVVSFNSILSVDINSQNINSNNRKNNIKLKTHDGVMHFQNPEKLLLIVDEAHRVRNNGLISRRIFSIAKLAHSVVFLSGTPFVNSPFDIAKHVNILKEKLLLPLDEEMFMKKFFNASANQILNEIVFKKAVESVFHVYKNIRNQNSFAQLTEITKFVEMIDAQKKLHDKLKKKLLNSDDLKLLNSKQPVAATKNINSFLSQTRQLSNVVKGNQNMITFKLKELSDHILKSKKSPIIVYSNFLAGGLLPLLSLLQDTSKSIELFTGNLKQAVKQDIMNAYNKKQIDILLLSSAGAEGLNLKRTREIHIMEPHWNQMRIDQVVGRGLRRNAHKNLNSNNRTLTVYQWICRDPDKQLTSADEYLVRLTKKKQKVIDLFIDFLNQSFSHSP